MMHTVHEPIQYPAPGCYPTQSFPYDIRLALFNVQLRTRAPHALVGSALIAAMATSVQGGYKVRLPCGGEPKPLGLFVASIAESGERKTTIDQLVFRPLLERDARLLQEHQREMVAYAFALEQWKRRKKSLERQRITTEMERVQQEACLFEHFQNKPTQPKLRRLIRQNLSERALMDTLEGEGQSVLITADEGERLLKSQLFEKYNQLSKGWDGGPLFADRANAQTWSATNIRMSISMMVQPSILESYLKSTGKTARGSGLLARFLFAFPTSTMGQRIDYNVATEHPMPDLLVFHKRMTTLLDDQNHPSENIKILEFSPDAKAAWEYLINYIETDLRPGGYFSDIKDFASKAGEMAARLAGVFHAFTGKTGLISEETFLCAQDLILFHLIEFKSIFTQRLMMPPGEYEADQLWNYIFRLSRPENVNGIPRTDLLHSGPLRNAKQFNAALSVLQWRGWIQLIPGGAKNKAMVVNLFHPSRTQIPIGAGIVQV